MKNTETMAIDLLFLELSQFTKATTEKELALIAQVDRLAKAIRPFAELVATTNGRIPHERLSGADWHELAAAYEKLK